MKMYLEPAREIPVFDSCDVVVAGGGPAGIAAAYAAAKHGMKTYLIEQANCLGGMAIPGMMSHWAGSTGSSVYREILNRCKNDPWECERLSNGNIHVINHEKQKLVIMELLQEVGVQILFHTMVVSACREGNKVTGIIMESKSGREVLESKVVIDCTGDGDVAAFAGAEYALGREGDGKMQPVTLMFKLAGVDSLRAISPGSFETLVDVPKGEIQNLGRQHLPKPAGHVLLYPSTIPGIVVVNMTNVIDIDATNTRDLTKAEMICAKQIPQIVKFLQEFAPGYEHCYAVSSAQNVGVRETRHFKGLYTITAEDIIEGTTFPDWIATKCGFNFDIHNVEGAGLDKNGAQKHFHSKGTYTIPYRCCIPEKIDGLLLSGRNISGTHKAHSNYRVMPICCGIGQGCGTAAAVAIQNGVSLRDVDAAEVQKLLLEDGVEL